MSELLSYHGLEPPGAGMTGELEQSNNDWREIIDSAYAVGIAKEVVTRWTHDPDVWVQESIGWIQNTIEGNGKQLFLEAKAVLNDPEVRRIAELIRGRSLLREELLSLFAAHEITGVDHWVSLMQAAALQGLLRIGCGVEAVIDLQKKHANQAIQWQCTRCGSGTEAMRFGHCPNCGGPCPYCERCLGMGRSRSCSPLFEGHPEREPNSKQLAGMNLDVLRTTYRERRSLPFQAEATSWTEIASREPISQPQLAERFGLSPAQIDASAAALAFLHRDELVGTPVVAFQRFLIWAVTGAGKTEMIFPLIEHEVRAGRTVLIATPRRDVVLELLPRMKKAFPDYQIIALYGGSEQRWEQGEITLATTHQLVRFRDKFDMVVIDELDAFPYHNNPMLQYAASKSIKFGGRCIYLSATPPATMQQEVKNGSLPYAMVPVRFHQHPLPVPWFLRTPPLVKWLQAERLPHKLKQRIDRSLLRGAQLFLFVPQIKWVNPLVNLLRTSYLEKVIGGTSSQDEERTDKVMDFRQKAIDILVTTTILERGVTIAQADVFVLDAGAGLFDEAALVQMAGRAGRSKDDPAGYVVFAAAELTHSQIGAVSQIRRMNRLAKQKGYLDCKKEGKGAGPPKRSFHPKPSASFGSLEQSKCPTHNTHSTPNVQSKRFPPNGLVTISNAIRQFLRPLISGIWSPPAQLCPTCGDTRKGAVNPLGICQRCFERIPWIINIQCPICGRPEICPDCKRGYQRFFLLNRSAVQYNEVMKELLARYKYRGDEKLAQLFGAMLYHGFKHLVKELGERAEETFD
ncbi:MAG: DEAD/DEAH box helicase family protein, partial [Gorillibacterium sp.]|nr:DEAD/DEAH box helicase family protein [Gorillibacterium sp.]